MGSLTSSGTSIVQNDNRFRHFGPNIQNVQASGAAQLSTAQIANTSFSVERAKHTVGTGANSGDLQHLVTRAMGIHASISDRRGINGTADSYASGLPGGDALGPLITFSERKVFWLDSDRGRTSDFADWTIFSASGVPVGTVSGVTDFDITPAATFDS